MAAVRPAGPPPTIRQSSGWLIGTVCSAAICTRGRSRSRSLSRHNSVPGFITAAEPRRRRRGRRPRACAPRQARHQAAEEAVAGADRADHVDVHRLRAQNFVASPAARRLRPASAPPSPCGRCRSACGRRRYASSSSSSCIPAKSLNSFRFGLTRATPSSSAARKRGARACRSQSSRRARARSAPLWRRCRPACPAGRCRWRQR